MMMVPGAVQLNEGAHRTVGYGHELLVRACACVEEGPSMCVNGLMYLALGETAKRGRVRNTKTAKRGYFNKLEEGSCTQ